MKESYFITLDVDVMFRFKRAYEEIEGGPFRISDPFTFQSPGTGRDGVLSNPTGKAVVKQEGG